MSSDNWDIWTLDNLWHFLGGLGINGIIFGGIGWWFATSLDLAAAIPIVGASGVVMVTLGAFLREFLQHADRDPIFRNHNISEALWWHVGAITIEFVFVGLYFGGIAFPGVG